jgi:excisionase family DNA binding protein
MGLSTGQYVVEQDRIMTTDRARSPSKPTPGDAAPQVKLAGFISGTHPWRILDSKWDGRSTFTVEETAAILGVSRCSAYAAAKKGEIPVVWIGRRAIVPRVALEQMLAGAVSAS